METGSRIGETEQTLYKINKPNSKKKKKKPSETTNAQVPIFKGIEDNAALFKCYDFNSSSLRYSFPTGLKHADV